jgi:prolyl-tRNA synthetase
LNAIELRPATDEEIQAVGAIPGYASPVGLKDILIIVDELIPLSTNLVAGANDEGYHLRNVNYGRDYSANIIADITTAMDAEPCVECDNPIHIVRGVEVGNIFKLGTHFSEAMGCYFLDKQGQSKPIVMGSYGIGVGRLLACIVEEHHDENGLKWPISVSPFQVHLVSLTSKKSDLQNDHSQIAEQLYKSLTNNQIECLYDDREESPGVKFNDADLIGVPIRLTVSERALKNGGIEYKRRDNPEKIIIPLENVLLKLKEEMNRLV